MHWSTEQHNYSFFLYEECRALMEVNQSLLAVLCLDSPGSNLPSWKAIAQTSFTRPQLLTKPTSLCMPLQVNVLCYLSENRCIKLHLSQQSYWSCSKTYLGGQTRCLVLSDFLRVTVLTQPGSPGEKALELVLLCYRVVLPHQNSSSKVLSSLTVLSVCPAATDTLLGLWTWSKPVNVSSLNPACKKKHKTNRKKKKVHFPPLALSIKPYVCRKMQTHRYLKRF